jgi:hypothetical protein
MAAKKKVLVSVLRIGGSWDGDSAATLKKMGFTQELTVDDVPVPTPTHVYVKYESGSNAAKIRDRVLNAIEPFNGSNPAVKTYVVISDDFATLLLNEGFAEALEMAVADCRRTGR